MIANAVILSMAYVCSVGGTLAWVFYTRQSHVSRNGRIVQLVAIRFAVVHAIVFIVCAIGNLAAWIPLVAVAVLWLLILSGNILSAAGIPLFYVVQQYVLGFPDREEWFLTQGPAPKNVANSLGVYIGKHALTSSPLKPCGEVKIDAESFPAASDSGDYINVGTVVVVRRVQNGKLIVSDCEFGMRLTAMATQCGIKALHAR